MAAVCFPTRICLAFFAYSMSVDETYFSALFPRRSHAYLIEGCQTTKGMVANIQKRAI